ncbi:MAG: hypothetical protein V5A44_12830 [Haloarculaceae archaeon]
MKRTPSERDDSENSMDRRSYLALAGAALGATAAGCLGGADGPDSDRRLRFGYGGGPYLFAAGSAALAAAASESEPNDACANAQAVSPDTDVSATLESSGVDWFGVDLAAGEEYEVVYDRAPATGVTSVVLYGPNCAFETMRQVGTDRQVSIGATARESGIHYVEIVDVQQGDGDYTVRVDTGSATATRTPTPTDTATATPAATTIADEYGEQGYGEYGYGGVSN